MVKEMGTGKTQIAVNVLDTLTAICAFSTVFQLVTESHKLSVATGLSTLGWGLFLSCLLLGSLLGYLLLNSFLSSLLGYLLLGSFLNATTLRCSSFLLGHGFLLR
jgi:hypothetical protein